MTENRTYFTLVIMKRPKRQVLEENLLVDALSLIGWTVFDAAVPGGLTSHVHPQNYEVCYVVQGFMSWWVGEEVYTVKRGDFFITKPGEAHGGVNGVMERCELYWLHFSFPLGDAYLANDSLVSDLNAIQHRAFPARSNIRVRFQQLINEHHAPQKHAALRSLAILHEILIDMVRAHDIFSANVHADSVGVSNEMMQAMTWIDEHLEHKFAVVDVATVVNMSPGYFHKRFLAETGATPSVYTTRRRVDKAQDLLQDHALSIARIAYELGFSSSQYFATVFKKYTGMTPREYRLQYTTCSI